MLEYRNIYKSFDAPVLQGASLRIDKGERVAIVGRSGTGKSVLLKLAIGLIAADSGDVILDGQKLSAASDAQMQRLRSRVGYVFQNAALFDSMTVFENVAFGLSEKIHHELSQHLLMQKVYEALIAVNLDPTMVQNKLPSELSGGMQKRVGLARAVVGQPAMLLFDEPVTGLDPITSAAVSYLIAKTAAHNTALLVTHDVQGALELVDRLALLADGHIVFDGTPKQFRASSHPLVRAFTTRSAAKEAALALMAEP